MAAINETAETVLGKDLPSIEMFPGTVTEGSARTRVLFTEPVDQVNEFGEHANQDRNLKLVS